MAERILYLLYLHSWKKTHRGRGFRGCAPACYAEWCDHELKEMITHPDWYSQAPFIGFLVESIREKRSRNA